MTGESSPAPPRTLEAILGPEYRKLEAALGKGIRQWLTPLNGKIPIQESWQKAPPATEDKLKRIAALGVNFGLRTGAVSGILVVDAEAPKPNCKTHGAACPGGVWNGPATLTIRTGSGGKHYYYRHVEGIKNSVEKLGPHLDVRSDGGQVVVPPGFAGHPYAIEIELPIAECPRELLQPVAPPKPLVEAPDKLVLFEGRAAAAPARNGAHGDEDARIGRYVDGAVRNCISELARTPEGQRNDALNKIAFRLGRFVGAGVLDKSRVVGELRSTAKALALDSEEIDPTIASGLYAGIDKPIDVESLRKKVSKGRAPVAGPAGSGPGTGQRSPQIFLYPGRSHDAMEEAENYMLKDGGPRLYQRGTMLVRPLRVETPAHGSIQRAVGSVVIRPVDLPYLVDRFSRHIEFYKYDGRNPHDPWKRCDCPDRIARNYLARIGHWRVPVLTGVIEAPTLRSDGSILESVGYDAATGLLFDPGTTSFQPLTPSPTLDQARSALTILRTPFDEFPWCEESDRSAALAAILAALVRRSIRTCPLFAYRAPQMRSGKSLLARCVGVISTGRPVPCMSPGKDEEELSKRIFAVFLEGDAAVCIDNVEHPLEGQSLCTALTEDVFKGRILGKSENAQVPTQTLWLATGNNLQFNGDLVSRVIPVDLDAGCEHPEERSFKINIRKFVAENRAQLVRAGLTILRAYHVAGRPAQGLQPYGGFEEFSDWIRPALVWVGEPDCCEGRRRLEATDPILTRLKSAIIHWPEPVDGARLTVADLIDRADQSRADLWNLFLELAVGADGKPHAGRLGKWLGRNANRVIDGRSIQRAGERNGSVLWQLTTRQPRGIGGMRGISPTTRDEMAEEKNDNLIHRAETTPSIPPIPLSAAPAPADGKSPSPAAVEHLAKDLFGAREELAEQWEH
jgi:hypothetical protein